MAKGRRRRSPDRPASRRYVAETVRRARDEIIRAVLWATAEPTEQMSRKELERRLRGYGGTSSG